MSSQLHSRFFGRASLCGAKPVTCMGLTFTPDEDTAYLEFTLSHCLPVTTFQGGALHPGTVFNSFGTLLHKNLNLGHNLRAYNPDVADQTLGTVLAVEWEGADKPPAGGWDIPKTRANAPGIRGVAVIHKNWQYADIALGLKVKTVSMEVTYDLEQSAFALQGDDGWEFIPWDKADAKLRACWSKPATGSNWSITGTYNGKKPALLFNGVNGSVRYLGLAVVTRGYENEATIERVLAGEADPDADTAEDKWKALADAMVKFATP